MAHPALERLRASHIVPRPPRTHTRAVMADVLARSDAELVDLAIVHPGLVIVAARAHDLVVAAWATITSSRGRAQVDVGLETEISCPLVGAPRMMGLALGPLCGRLSPLEAISADAGERENAAYWRTYHLRVEARIERARHLVAGTEVEITEGPDAGRWRTTGGIHAPTLIDVAGREREWPPYWWASVEWRIADTPSSVLSTVLADAIGG